jgi:ComF family protein
MGLRQLATLTSRLIEFGYPPQCVACANAIEGDAQLCGDCAIEMSALEAQAFCDPCGMPIPEHGAPCPHCLGKGVPHFDRVIRLGVFRDPLKHLIHQMKYHRRWAIAEILAHRMIEREPVKALLSQADVLVPVPLHAFRHISRGYNQAEVIARTIGRLCGIKVACPLSRVKRTPPQIAMTSHEKRVENMRGAFRLDLPKAVAGKHVVVVDDVMTTGSTLRAAAQQLTTAKPASMAALVVAVADPRGRDFHVI